MRAPPLKLLMTADAVGGVFTYAVALAGALVPHGITTTLLVLGPPMNPAQRTAAERVPGLRVMSCDVPLDWLAPSPAAVMEGARRIADMAEGADVVQLNNPAFAVARFPAPVVGVVHSCLASWWRAVESGPLPADFAWRTQMLQDGITGVDALVCPSHAFAQEVASLYGRPPFVVYNGRAPQKGGSPRAGSGHAFTAGRLWDAGKNISTLDLAAEHMTVPLRAAGPMEGPDGHRIALRHARPCGTLDAAGMAKALACAPIFVSASIYEPFGLAVLEAAQAGCPLVLSDIPTFRELWDGVAFFAPPHDAHEFANAVNALANDPALRVRLGIAARGRGRRYRLAAMAQAMAGLYRRLAPPRRGAALPSRTGALT